MIANFIAAALSNFTLTFLVIGLIAAAISLARKPKPLSSAVVVEEVFAYFLLFSIGLSNIYNFVLHVFFGEMTAGFIGWAQSPFQAEVGFASLGFGIVGLLAFRGSYGLRLGAVVAPSLFLLGAAGGHIYQMVTQNNFAPGNAGAIFFTDILIPLFGFVMLGLERRSTESGRAGVRRTPARP